MSPDSQRKLVEILQKERARVTDWRPYQDGGDLFADTDKGQHSAYKRDNIPAWNALEKRVESDPTVADVAAYDASRCYRNVAEAIAGAKRFHKYGVQLVFGREGPVDLDSADGEYRFIDAANRAQYESRKTTERLRVTYDQWRERGLYMGHKPPCGLKLVGTRYDRHLEQSDEKPKGCPHTYFATVVRWLELYRSGLGMGRAAQHLNAEGYKWHGPHGEPVVVKAQRLNDTLIRLRLYQPFLDPKLYRACMRLRGERAGGKANHAPQKYPALLAQRVIRCDRCGARLSVYNHRTPYGKVWRGYRHGANGCAWSDRLIAESYVAPRVWIQLERLERIPFSDVEAAWKRVERPARRTDARAEKQAELERLRGTLAGIDSALLDAGFSEESKARYRVKLKDVERRIKEVEGELAAIPATSEELPLSRDELRELWGNLTRVLKRRAEPNVVNAVVRAVFERITVDYDTRRLRFELRPAFKHLMPR